MSAVGYARYIVRYVHFEHENDRLRPNLVYTLVLMAENRGEVLKMLSYLLAINPVNPIVLDCIHDGIKLHPQFTSFDLKGKVLAYRAQRG